MDVITLLQQWFLLFYGQTVTKTVIWPVWLFQNFSVDKSMVSNYLWNEQFMKLSVQSVMCCQPPWHFPQHAAIGTSDYTANSLENSFTVTLYRKIQSLQRL